MPAKRAAKAPRSAPRRRRTAVEARRAILEAAQKRLADGGPEAIRLQEIARDLDISHPAILHHFESREGLMRALALYAVERLDAELVQAIGDPSAQPTPAGILDRVFDALSETGMARLLGWYALSHFTPEPEREEQYILRHVARVLQTRLEQETRTEAALPDEAVFVVHLAAVALLGDAIFGRLVSHSLGTPNDRETQRLFRRRLATFVSQRLGLP
jgi:AcrR family transcriptional regulator